MEWDSVLDWNGSVLDLKNHNGMDWRRVDWSDSLFITGGESTGLDESRREWTGRVHRSDIAQA